MLPPWVLVSALVCCNSHEAEAVDADRDGALSPDDCDDQNPSVHPGAVDDCGPEDGDCDGRKPAATVDGRPFATVQEAVQSVESGGTVLVCPGIHDEGREIEVPAGVDLTLASWSNDRTDTVLDGGSRHSLVWAPEGVHLSLENLTLTHGRADRPCAAPGDMSPCGGAIILAGKGTLKLNHCDLLANDGGEAGGAILAFGLPAGSSDELALSIEDSKITNNVADEGGGISVGGYGWPDGKTGLEIASSSLVGNFARGGAGAAFSFVPEGRATLRVSRSTISRHLGYQPVMAIDAYLAVYDVSFADTVISDNASVGSSTLLLDQSFAAGPNQDVYTEADILFERVKVVRNSSPANTGVMDLGVHVRFESKDSDWGTGPDDNVPHDYMSYDKGASNDVLDVGAHANFVCDHGASCVVEPP